MKTMTGIVLALTFSSLSVCVLAEEEFAPYGTAEKTKTQYSPQKIAFSVMSTADDTKSVLQQLQQVLKQYAAGGPKGSQVEVVVIGATVGAFAKENYAAFQPQIDAIAEMTKEAAPIKVVLCGNSIRNAGYKNEDMHGFAEIAPAGYIELAYLAQNGYAIAPINIVKTKDARYYFRPEKKSQAPTASASQGKK